MRVTNLGSLNSQLGNINDIKNKINSIGTDISTTKKIHKPSDDPSGASRVINFEKQLSSNNTYLQNISKSSVFMDTTNSTLDNMYSKITEALTELKFASNPENDGQREIFANKIDGLFDNLLDLANTEYDGKYLFGGTDFSDKPYVYDEATNQVTLGVADVSGQQNVKISKNITQAVNIPGSELFGDIDGTDIFNTLLTIRTELENDNIPSEDLVKRVEAFGDNVLEKSSKSGSILNQIYATEEMINNQNLTLESLISDESDTDIAKSVIELQNYEYSLQLAYRVSSMTMSKSLMDFL